MVIQSNNDGVAYVQECLSDASVRHVSISNTASQSNTDAAVFSYEYPSDDVTVAKSSIHNDTKCIKVDRQGDTEVYAKVDTSVDSDSSTTSSVSARVRARAKKVSRQIRLKMRNGLDLNYRKFLLGTISVILFCLSAMYIREYDVVGTFLIWVETAPVWTATLAFSALYFFVALPIGFGYLILNLGAGYLYGLWVGMLVTVISSSVGTFLAVVSCRFFLHDWVHSKIESYPTMGALLRVVNGPSRVRVIILSRLSPFPYGLQNAVFSLCNVGMVKFSLISFLACIPMQFLNTWMGTKLKSIQDVLAGGGSMDAMTYALFVGQLVVGALLLAGVLYATKIEFHKMVGEESGGIDLECGSGDHTPTHVSYQPVASESDSDDEMEDTASIISEEL
ncbi:hypothetical protein SARC_01546 [Sphaeroforma arctica JP610]|uniref:VTT domain-containing protein n=1 Tax=Sphaeroforma arctica JP610 TaxID=667725 RepID=A0A0L0GBJ6_9EUKA|nr:hypothetical protein SARC_01546 [Sphaeroforma arctica JP610]KNC86284.1 hypothetical protein SARC_01546 [Sphaeroforma arctica JP610]|eukprot:XP_014160186.1 hypothetical protein SARC_01546 [Sphaeroforma arctica JP610]